MSDKPLVSVVMIFLNVETFIQEAIASVFSQTYAHWELLLVDDGSTDASTRIALRYANQYPAKVRYLEHQGHQNRGMSASRNLGVRTAKGDYVAFLDADDVYLPEKLERQVAVLESQPAAAMVYSATQHWYSWTGNPNDQRNSSRKLGVPPDTLVDPPTLPRLFLQRKAQTPGTCGVLVRREAIERVGMFEERFRGMFEDQVFFYKLLLNKHVYLQSGVWDRYRQHPQSHNRVMSRKGAYDRAGGPSPTYRMFLQWLESYLIQHQINDPNLWQALNKELWPYRHPVRYRLVTMVRRVWQARKPKQLVRRLLKSVR